MQGSLFMGSDKYGLEYRDGRVRFYKTKSQLKDALYRDTAYGNFETVGLIRDGGIVVYRIK